MKPQRKWTAFELSVLEVAFKHFPTPLVARALHRTDASVELRAYALGMRKSARGRTRAMQHAWMGRRMES